MSRLQAAILNMIIGFGVIGVGVFLLLSNQPGAGGFMLVLGVLFTLWHIYEGDKK